MPIMSYGENELFKGVVQGYFKMVQLDSKFQKHEKEWNLKNKQIKLNTKIRNKKINKVNLKSF